MSARREGRVEFMGFGPRFRRHGNFVSQCIKSEVPGPAGRNRFRASLIVMTLLCWVGMAMAESPGKIDVSGTWKGTRATSGQTGAANYRVQSISFDLSQSGDTITGSYRCYAGKQANTDCPSPTGKVISGTIKNDGIKIEVKTLPNQIMCSFKGKINETKMNGTYSCYAGGSLSTIGTWKTQRQQLSE